VDDPVDYMKKLAILVKIKGKLFITVPWNWGKFREHLWKFDDRKDIVNLNPDQLQEETNVLIGERFLSILKKIC